ncbi:MAG: hypothetical protein ABI614_17530 [Planctomycetota bacterium]
MTRYTVVWHNDALTQLAAIWIIAPNREAITLAAKAIDRHLADDAPTKGIAVEGDLRLVTVPPLRLLYAVSEADRMVRILDVTSP